ncbi:MAG: metallophosphoesterase [Acetivibrionales bacterium]
MVPVLNKKTLERISEVFNSSDQITIDDSSRVVIMSDCHRGDGSWADDFLKNQNIYFTALTHYYNNNYTYIEIGDGDELWKNKKLSEIIQQHSDAYWLMSKFFNKGRLYLIYGNHDIDKKNSDFVKKNLYQYYYEREKTFIPLFKNIKLHEGLILKHSETNGKIFLIHGHQADNFNGRLWKMSRFLVRNLWRPLSSFGIKDPTSAAKNHVKKETIEKILTAWVIREKNMLIAGHTHRPMFPEPGKPPYFNDGSCVHPRCITAIEISDGYIMLVKWSVKVMPKTNGRLFVSREVLAGPELLKNYFSELEGER